MQNFTEMMALLEIALLSKNDCLTPFVFCNRHNLTVHLLLVWQAEIKVYFATRYYDPHVSNLVLHRFSGGVTTYILDGNPEQISVENRLSSIMRTPPNRETTEMVKKVLKSSRFDLKRLPSLPLSFIIVDGIQVVYETVNFANPEQFTVAVSKYDDVYFAKRFIEYYKLLSKDSITPELFIQHRPAFRQFLMKL